jgi:protein gp37
MGQSNISYLTHVWSAYSWTCTPVSEGCQNCYARETVERRGGKFREPVRWRETADKLLREIPSGAVCGVNFHSDMFHEDATLEMIRRVHQSIASRPGVTFVYTTKRS